GAQEPAIPQELKEEAERLLKDITPGEWRAVTRMHPEAIRLKKECVAVYGPESLIYRMSRDYVCLPETYERQKRDAEFIAAAPRIIRGLLAALASPSGHQEQENPGTSVVFYPDSGIGIFASEIVL
ncbi:MAG: hypothetical protein AB7J46_06770, partial [Candidatus Altimarinota bacterium]